MTLEELKTKLEILLQEAVNSGLDVDDVGQIAEETIANGDWGSHKEDVKC